MRIKFGDQVMSGALGRNGIANIGGVEVSPHGQVTLSPLSVSGERLRCEISFHPEDCGRVAGLIASAGVRCDPGERARIAADLRSALALIEAGFHEVPDDGVSGFHSPPR